MKSNFAVFLLVIAFAAYASDPAWRQKMRRVSATLAEVIPFLYPGADKDVKGLTTKIEKLHSVTEKLDVENDHMIGANDFDPGLPFLANSLKEDVDRAYRSVKEGYPDYARYVLKESTSYCIACHTRAANGPQFPLLDAFAEPLKAAPWIVRMEFLAASRQYDTVYEEVMKALAQPSAVVGNSLDLDRGCRLALSIAVRVKQSPEMALRLAKAVRSAKQATYVMKQEGRDWSEEIGVWQREKPKSLSGPSEILDEGRRLVARAKSSSSRGHDEIYYLRATVLLHDLILKFPKSREMPEALYLIGESYTPLQELGLWNLQEKYFQACIQEAPHSDLAEKCYKRFEESVVFGFSGSSGTHVPPELKRQLKSLKNTAQKAGEKL